MILYQIFFAMGFTLLSPLFLYAFVRRHKWKRGLKQRFGIYPHSYAPKDPKQKTIWFHAASVGEVGTITDLVRVLKKEQPLYKIIITTLTSTGQDLVRKKLPDEKNIYYYPFDFTFSVERAISMFEPDFFILVEAEIWPQLLYRLQSRAIPTAMVNVRMSKRSFRRYYFFRFFIRLFIEKMAFITVPSQEIADQMILLGARKDGVHITGNLKYDKPYFRVPEEGQLEKLRSGVGFDRNHMILLCGSTHPGEEEILIRVYGALKNQFPMMRLIIAPRHPKRSIQISAILNKSNISYEMRSMLKANTVKDVLILDTLGELEGLYAIADIVFIGKSLTKKGGQNMMEPARYAKPILFGPHMENFREMSSVFLKENAAIEVQDEKDLRDVVKNLMASKAKRASLGEKAQQIWMQHSGAFDKHISIIQSL
ncbi:MAG: glycosyltransferase N-terminal domain-containing protein [Chlamydiota bacterium]|nr:glycosyltransferase N-terminal domain-containing protein [Chlamydiota bacterium]